MNFKDRGITVGDLLILVVIILATTTIFKTFKNDKKTTYNLIKQEQISFKTILLSKNQFNYNSL